MIGIACSGFISSQYLCGCPLRAPLACCVLSVYPGETLNVGVYRLDLWEVLDLLNKLFEHVA